VGWKATRCLPLAMSQHRTWQSGSFDREQGIGKSGNPRLRSRLLEMAWLWVRHQPGSLLSRWFNDRVAQNGGRFNKVMITALARKLVVASWKYVSAGVSIENSHLAVTTLVNHSSARA
jgi:transposase